MPGKIAIAAWSFVASGAVSVLSVQTVLDENALLELNYVNLGVIVICVGLAVTAARIWDRLVGRVRAQEEAVMHEEEGLKVRVRKAEQAVADLRREVAELRTASRERSQ